MKIFLQLARLNKELKDYGAPAMIELLESKGNEKTPAETALLKKLTKKQKKCPTDWVSVRFQGRAGTQRFLNRLLRLILIA